MVTTRKRGKYYYVDYYHNGKRKKKSVGTSKKVADLIAKDIEVKLAREDSGLFIKDILISKFLAECREYIKVNHRPRTADRYRTAIDQFESFLKSTSIKKLSQVTPAVFEKYKTHRSGKIKNQTLNMELKIWKTFFNLAIKWDYLKYNPLNKVASLSDIGRKIPRFFSKEEARMMIEASEQPYRDIFTILLFTGMRRNELRFLEVSDIDFKRARILIREKAAFKPKTAERAVPIHPTLMPILKASCDGKQGLIFPTRKGTPYPENYWWKKMKKITAILNIPNAGPHVFRHTFASWLVMTGVDLRTVQRLLGHSNIQTTMIYSHLAEQHLDESIKNISFDCPNLVPIAENKKKPSQIIDL